MWEEGEYKDYKYQAKVYDKGSHFGINNGRVSKLWIYNVKTGEVLYNYDRGLDFDNLKDQEVLQHILSLYPDI